MSGSVQKLFLAFLPAVATAACSALTFRPALVWWMTPQEQLGTIEYILTAVWAISTLLLIVYGCRLLLVVCADVIVEIARLTAGAEPNEDKAAEIETNSTDSRQ